MKKKVRGSASKELLKLQTRWSCQVAERGDEMAVPSRRKMRRDGLADSQEDPSELLDIAASYLSKFPSMNTTLSGVLKLQLYEYPNFGLSLHCVRYRWLGLNRWFWHLVIFLGIISIDHATKRTPLDLYSQLPVASTSREFTFRWSVIDVSQIEVLDQVNETTACPGIAQYIEFQKIWP